jgi:hypothetical protein
MSQGKRVRPAHALLQREREERAPERPGILLFRDLREVSLDEDHGDRIRFAKAEHLVEDSLRDDGGEKVRDGLALDRDFSDDVVSRGDLPNLDVRAELAQSGGDVRRLALIGNDHDTGDDNRAT